MTHQRVLGWTASTMFMTVGALGFGVLSGGCAQRSEITNTVYYAGTTEVRVSDTRSFPGPDTLARRWVAGSRAEEHVVTAGRLGQAGREFYVDFEVLGNKLTFKERSGAFIGSGTYEGDPAHWTSWRTESRMTDGTIVISNDVVAGKSLIVDKRVMDPSGALRVSIRERYEEIGFDEFERRRVAMLATNTGEPAAPKSPASSSPEP